MAQNEKLQGYPKRLANKDWGVEIRLKAGDDAPSPGQQVEITPKSGNSWTSTIQKIESNAGQTYVCTVDNESRRAHLNCPSCTCKK